MLARGAQEASLRQIARSHHTSYEAVRRLLHAARKELVPDEGEPSDLKTKDKEDQPSKEQG
jgi:hypothetical protein